MFYHYSIFFCFVFFFFFGIYSLSCRAESVPELEDPEFEFCCSHYTLYKGEPSEEKE